MDKEIDEKKLREELRQRIKEFIEKRYKKYQEDPKLMSNERQACDSLIRPFFRDILGWDVDNPYEFKSEYPQGGKRVDYIACIDNVSQFIIEAKAPSREIRDKGEFYKQAIQYAEDKERDFAILINFKNIIIFRAGIETKGPYANEILRIDLLDLKDGDLDFLSYFTRSFWIEQGDNNPLYSKNNIKKKEKIDEKLIKDMSNWREILLRSLKANLKKDYELENEEIFSHVEEEVQRFIDRLIFICSCEDRQLTDTQLKPFLNEKKRIVSKDYLLKKLRELFEKYKKDFNSDLFEKGLCDDFNFDEITIKDILEDLRDPLGKLPYDFSTIDADILGRAYEGFLGHIMTGKKRFKEKQDIGKRKKEGIYYTPAYIVNYIVLNTVREKIKGKTFKEILKIKILDPACGSGSFLIKAFDILMEESKISLGKKELTYEQKKDLLLNCIHGVDLDERACDIAKLNLSLKIASKGEKIPDLHDNIKNGNSLIDNEIAGDKAFKWEEKFPFKFDVIIGNPPYIDYSKIEGTEYFNKNYISSKVDEKIVKYNLFQLFIEKSIKLLKEKGIFGFINPNTYLSTDNAFSLRKLILGETKLNKIIDVSHLKVFKEASTYPVITIFTKGKDKDNRLGVAIIDDERDIIFNLKLNEIKQEEFEKDKNLNFMIGSTSENKGIISKLETYDRLNIYQEIFVWGSSITGFATHKAKEKENDKKYSPMIQTKDIKRYCIDWKKEYIETKIYSDKLKELFKQKKIVIARVTRGVQATMDENEFYVGKSSILIPKDKNLFKILLAILNSNLINYYYKMKFETTHMAGGYIRFDIPYLKLLPIKLPDEKQTNKINELVDKLLSLNNQLLEIGNKDKYKRENKEKESNDVDKQINQEVYKLYGITKDEQAIIEKSLESAKK